MWRYQFLEANNKLGLGNTFDLLLERTPRICRYTVLDAWGSKVPVTGSMDVKVLNMP